MPRDLGTHDNSTKQFSRWLFRIVKSLRSVYRDVLLASLLLNLFVVVSPLFVMNVYDRVVPNLAFETLWTLALGVLIVFVFDFVIRSLRHHFLEAASRRIDVTLSNQLFSYVLSLPSFRLNLPVGGLAAQLKDFDAIKQLFSATSFTSLLDVPFVLVFLLVIYVLGGSLVWVPILAILGVLCYSYFSQIALKRTFRKLQDVGVKRDSLLIETLSNHETIKVMNAETGALDKWSASVSEYAQLTSNARRLSDSVAYLSGFLMQLTVLVLVVSGVYLIGDGRLSLGGLIACVLLGTRALAPMVQVAHLGMQLYHARVAIESLNALTANEGEQGTSSDAQERKGLRGDVRFENTTLSYQQEKPVLSACSLHIKPGERVALIGRVGSGKSSLLKSILGLVPIRSGSIKVDDCALAHVDLRVLRRACAYVPQDVSLITGTLRQNLLIKGGEEDDATLMDYCRLAGIGGWVNSHPNGLDMPVAEGGKDLSGGQRQSIAIARALTGQPDMYLFDELTSAMDNQTEAEVVQQLNTLTQGKTLILSTHRASLLTMVDRVIVLDQGQIVADGPKETVLNALKSGQVVSRGEA